jgi:hypothetical protein
VIFTASSSETLPDANEREFPAERLSGFAGLKETSGKAGPGKKIEVREMDPAAHLTAQHHHLVSKRRILSLKPALRLDRRDQDADDEAQQRDHRKPTLSDFVANQSV